MNKSWRKKTMKKPEKVEEKKFYKKLEKKVDKKLMKSWWNYYYYFKKINVGCLSIILDKKKSEGLTFLSCDFDNAWMEVSCSIDKSARLQRQPAT